jgi:ribosomal-protein-alanine N-acetyltransferase
METGLLDIKIIPMTRNDIDAVLDIEQSAYGDHHWSHESFSGELSNELASYFCAFDESGNLAAYSGCWQILNEAHITTIAVAPLYRRRHIGEALLVNLINTCRENGVNFITLEVRVSNAAAIKLYEKYSFKSLGTRKGYYQNNNEDALIMWTENICYDKFRNKFNENAAKLKAEINVIGK